MKDTRILATWTLAVALFESEARYLSTTHKQSFTSQTHDTQERYWQAAERLLVRKQQELPA